MAQARAYCFTINNWSDHDFDQMQALEYRYLIMGKEVGENGTPHLQGYIYFENKKSFRQVKQMHVTAHWEVAQGSVEQNFLYCSKDCDFTEFGEKPMSSKRKGEVGGAMEITRYQNAWDKAKTGDFEDIDADIRFKCYRTLKEIKKDYMQPRETLTELMNLWIYGPPGVGKSRKAFADYPGAFNKLMNKWWDGYQDEEYVIIDDFERDTHLGHNLKIWGDYRAFPAEVKGGCLNIRPKAIIITSNYTIDECIECEHMRAAIKRRYKVIHMTDPFHVNVPPLAIAPTFVPPPPVLIRSEELPLHDNPDLDPELWEIAEIL
nr:MAG: replication associated protein [Arizlama virus]